MLAYPRVLKSGQELFASARFHVPKTLLELACAWAILNLCFGTNPAALSVDALRPSLDATVLIAAFAGWALLRRRLPHWIHYVVASIALVTLALRIADGIEDEFFHRKFNVTLDFHLIREGVRLLHQTMPLSDFIAFCVGSVLGFAAAVVGLYWASAHAFRSQQKRIGRVAFVAGTLATVTLGSRWAGFTETTLQRAVDAFAPSVLPRLNEEVTFAMHAAGYRSETVRHIEAVQEKLKTLPSDLARLDGGSVHLFLIESMGICTFEKKAQFDAFLPVINESARQLRAAGFSLASNYMESPTYGSGSQFAQFTLGTGIRVENHLEYRLAMASNARTLPRYFNQAGYRTVFAMPGTRLDWPEGSFWGFDKLYDRWQFDYGGPVLGWGELPDQYTVDAIRRNELAEGHGPVFAEYALITSHGPWATVPYFFRNWDRIGNGVHYGRVRSKRFAGLSWSDMRQAPQAYVETVSYDMQVITDFLLRFVDDKALIIALGDHQPVTSVSGRGSSYSVPVFVFSKNKEHVDRFIKRGYVAGLIPNQPLPHLPMEDFLEAFLTDFSRAPAKSNTEQP